MAKNNIRYDDPKNAIKEVLLAADPRTVRNLFRNLEADAKIRNSGDRNHYPVDRHKS